MNQDEDQDLYSERAGPHAPVTGDARVDGAMAQLSRLQDQAPAEHVAILEEVHGRLRDILDELSEGPDRPGPL